MARNELSSLTKTGSWEKGDGRQECGSTREIFQIKPGAPKESPNRPQYQCGQMLLCAQDATKNGFEEKGKQQLWPHFQREPLLCF